MKLNKRQQRTARKLVLPLIAIGMMATMMFSESASRSSHASSSPTAISAPRPVAAPGMAARTAPDLRQR